MINAVPWIRRTGAPSTIARIARSAVSLAAVAVLGAMAGCATLAPSKSDPLEPMNRALYNVHEAIDTVLLKPVAEVYTAVVPPLIRTGVANVANNLDDFFSAINAMLQGKPDKWGYGMGRVMLNSFVGLGGIFDIASDLGNERGEEDFGQTFGVWGFPQGPYLFIPILGPTTVRDGTGFLVRFFSGPTQFINDDIVRWSLYGLWAVDERARLLDATRLIDQAAIDKYVFIRNAYLQRRRYLLYDGKPPPETEEE